MNSPEFRSTDEMLDLVQRSAAGRIAGARRRQRWVASAGALVVVAVVTAALFAVSAFDDETQDRASVAAGPDPAAGAPEGWSLMADSPLSPRAGAVTAWTGKEMLIWGGESFSSDSDPNDGAAYNPATDTWRPMAPSPMPDRSPGVIYATAWTGAELIAWGGFGPTAAAYDPDTDTWRSLDPGPLSGRSSPSWVWTGSELVVVGGQAVRRLPGDGEDQPEPGEPLHDAAAFNPSTGKWRSLPDLDVDTLVPTLTWTGDRVIALARAEDGEAAVLSLEPGAESWERGADAPLERLISDGTWAGGRLVVGGMGRVDATAGEAERTGLVTRAYDPLTDRWSNVDRPPGVDPLFWNPQLVWSGDALYALMSPQAEPGGFEPLAVWVLDQESGSWRGFAPSPLRPRSGGSSLGARSGGSAVWADGELLVWGGASYDQPSSVPFADGARYRPPPGAADVETDPSVADNPSSTPR